MTAGYDPSNPVASGTSDSHEYDRPRHADRSAPNDPPRSTLYSGPKNTSEYSRYGHGANPG